MTRIFALFALSTLLLAGCGTSTNRTGEDLAAIVRAERAAPKADAKCLVPGDLVGKHHTELAKRKFDAPIRVIYPGTTVTGETIANRLNFKVDKKGVINQITCG